MRANHIFIFPLRVGLDLVILECHAACISHHHLKLAKCMEPYDATNSVFKLTNHEEHRIYTLC